jgi:acyl carrier protein
MIQTAVEPSAEIIHAVNQLLQTGFEVSEEKLVPGASLQADLGLDSLDAVDMLVYLEEKMGVKIEGERLRSVKTLQDVYLLAAEAAARADADGKTDLRQ